MHGGADDQFCGTEGDENDGTSFSQFSNQSIPKENIVGSIVLTSS